MTLKKEHGNDTFIKEPEDDKKRKAEDDKVKKDAGMTENKKGMTKEKTVNKKEGRMSPLLFLNPPPYTRITSNETVPSPSSSVTAPAGISSDNAVANTCSII